MMVGKLLSFLGVCFFRGELIHFGSVISLSYKYKLSQGDVCYQDRPWKFCDAQFGSFHFEAREMRTWGFWGPSNFPKKKQKKVSTVPKKNIPPALSWQRHSLVVSTIFVTSMVVSFFSHLGIAEKRVRSSAGDKTNSSDSTCESKKNTMQAV